MRRMLRVPQRELTVHMPVRCDNGRLTIAVGHRIQHSLTRGPSLGSLRFCAELTLDSLRAAAMLATWQCAIAGVPFGGSAGGIVLDQASLSAAELERATRRYVTDVGCLLGADRDILAAAPDTPTEVLAWAIDTLSMQRGTTTLAAAVGKPSVIGGSSGHNGASWGILTILEIICDRIGLNLSGACTMIVGDDTLDTGLADLLTEQGARLEQLPVYAAPGRPCDILVLSAGAPPLDEAQAADIYAYVVVEAGGMVSMAAEAILEARGVIVIPDVLAGVGQVTAGYLEWVQGLQQFFWSEREVHAQIDRVAMRATNDVLKLASERRVSIRVGAMMLAVMRVMNAIAVRGIYP
jgi:glutamate dehydrogenase (NAD(P)+)